MQTAVPQPASCALVRGGFITLLHAADKVTERLDSAPGKFTSLYSDLETEKQVRPRCRPELTKHAI